MAQLASDPALARAVIADTDLVICLAPVTNSAGQLTGYIPYNITAAEFAAQIVQKGMLAIGATLPGIAPEGGGLFLNAGAFSYSAVTGTQSGAVLTTEAMQKSYTAWLASLPVSDPGTGTGNYWNNDGVATESVLIS